jgi:HSP20 family molecular chaperone IbpA
MGAGVMDPNVTPASNTLPNPGSGDSDILAAAIQAAALPMSVPVNMYEADEALVIVAAMPGVMAGDIEVTVEKDCAWLRSGLRSLAPKPYLVHEWHYGPYERLVEIPHGFEGPAAAHFGNGQLALRIERGGRRAGPITVAPGSA